jgi:uncharacterized protein YoxC
MSTSILIYIIGAVIAIVILWIVMIEYRLKKFFTGTNARNLEEVMNILGKDISEIKKVQKETKEHLVIIDKRLNKSIRNIKTIRFNPFVDAGSNQSFAISFLNDEGDGVIMSSLYARDRMSIFAKPINNGKSDFELSDEEKDVLEKAK